ncbi:MAG: 50S ribosomal protein L10 [bacterium]
MAKTKKQKKNMLADMADKMNKAKSIVFASFDALGVKDNEDLRKELKQENSEYYVAKKTLFNLALKDAKLENIDVKNFSGQLAVIFGYDDEVAPAKIIAKFDKSHPGKIEFMGGILENRFIEPDQVMALSKLPSKQELYANLVRSINVPFSMVNALAGNFRNLVYVLNAVGESKK